MLTHIKEIDVKEYELVTELAIKNRDNILIFGPSGAGKTIIAQEVANKHNCRLVYINLSVLERTDFQGFPVVSDDKAVVNYATAEFMPFSDASTLKERKVLETMKRCLGKDPKYENMIAEIDAKLIRLDKIDTDLAIHATLPYMKNKPDMVKKLSAMLNFKDDDKIPTVVLFDEVDKAASETTAPLLEFLQFGSINGRKMNIAACILTANLNDEHAHSNNISHAISKRCKTYQLNVDFDKWRSWAFKNNVHDLIVQYLASEPTMIYQKAPDGDPTAYALPAPRTWTDAGKALSVLDSDDNYKNMSSDKLDHLRELIISGAVGTAAATKWMTWYKFFREFDPAINELVEKGTFPEQYLKGRSWKDVEKLIIAIAACSKHAKEIKNDNEIALRRVTSNVYKWLATQHPEHQVAASRMSLSLTNDEDFVAKVSKHKLLDIPEFKKCFHEINEKFRKYGSVANKNK